MNLTSGAPFWIGNGITFSYVAANLLLDLFLQRRNRIWRFFGSIASGRKG